MQRVYLLGLLERLNLRARFDGERRVLSVRPPAEPGVDRLRACQRDPFDSERPGRLEDVLQSRRVNVVVDVRRDAAGGRGGEADDAVDVVTAEHVVDLERVGHVHALDEHPFAHLVLDDVGHAVGAVLRDDDVLALLEESYRCVEPDETHAADDQDHDVFLRSSKRSSRRVFKKALRECDAGLGSRRGASCGRLARRPPLSPVGASNVRPARGPRARPGPRRPGQRK